MKYDRPCEKWVEKSFSGFIGIYNGFQNLKFLADIQGKIGEKEIRQAMSKVGLDPDNKTKVDNYSLGMKQKLGIAQAIMEGQDILILDEPFNALDYKTYEDEKTIIRMLKAEGKTIFLTSHHFKDIEQLCDQVYSIEDCQLVPITEEIAAHYREMDWLIKSFRQLFILAYAMWIVYHAINEQIFQFAQIKMPFVHAMKTNVGVTLQFGDEIVQYHKFAHL